MTSRMSIDPIRALGSQYSHRQPWNNDCFSYLTAVVYAILKQREDGAVSCLLIAANGTLAIVPPEAVEVNPGTFKLAMTVDRAKEVFAQLRNAGHVLVVYKYGSFSGWIKELDAVAQASKAYKDPYDLLAINKWLPECHTYVELFSGGAPLLYAREPSPVEVCNDRGSYVTDFAKSLREADRFNCFFVMSRIFPFAPKLLPDVDALRRFVQCTPRDTFNVTRSFAWYSMVRRVYAAAYSTLSAEARAVLIPTGVKSAAEALGCLDPYLPQIHGRMLRVQYENNLYTKVVNTFDSETTLFWVDIPIDVGMEEVVEAVNVLNDATGAVALYLPTKVNNLPLARGIYEGLLSGWTATSFARSIVYTRNVR